MNHGMITSASGWRKVFAVSGDENDNTEKISENDEILAGICAEVFADYLIEKNENPRVILGRDTRPTGKAICEAILKILVSKKIRVKYPGIIAAPEIMAYGKKAAGATTQSDITESNSDLTTAEFLTARKMQNWSKL